MDTETLHIFDAYTRGELSEAEALAFEQQLTSNAELQKEFEEYIHLVNGVRAYEKEKIKALMKDRKIRMMNTNQGWHSFKRVAVAAAILLIIVVPGYIIFRTTTRSARLANEYYIQDPGVPVTMSANSHSMFNQAMIAFKDNQFQESLAALTLLLADDPANDTLNYYSGICLFETGKTEEAIQHLGKISDPVSPYYYQARYNLGLCYIKIKDTDKARDELTIVSDHGSGTLKKKAMELLNKL